MKRHQDLILINLGFRKFDSETKEILENESQALCANQLKPRSLFMSLVNFLRSKKIEVSTYYMFAEIITNSLKEVEGKIVDLINKHISPKKKKLLNDLLSVSEQYSSVVKQKKKIKRYKLTLLKKSSQSTKPSKIKENIEDLKCLKSLSLELEPIISKIKLTSEIIQYYAQIVIKSQIFQISRRDKPRYLYLIAFVIHQYYKLNDLLIEALLQSVQTAQNTSVRNHKEAIYNARHSKQKTIAMLSQNLNNHLNTLKQIDKVININDLSDTEKVDAVKNLLANDSDRSQIEENMWALEKESNRILKNEDYYDILESKSLKLQNRVSQIIKCLEFENKSSNSSIINAIQYFREKDGILGVDAPIEFLDEDQRKTMHRFIDPKYQFFYSVSTCSKNLSKKAENKTTQANVGIKSIQNFLVPLPPASEQHRIVAKVDELMALCDRLERRQGEGDATHQALVATLLATLTRAADATELAAAWQRLSAHFHTLFTTPESIDHLKQILLQLAVMGKLVPQDPNDEPASVLLEKIAQEKKRLVKEEKIKKQKKLPEINEDEK